MSNIGIFAMHNVHSQGIWDGCQVDTLHVDWQLLDMCNYKCSYCYDQQKPVKQDFSREQVLHIAKNILSLNRPNYSFRLVGGEPTLHPYFTDIVDYLYNSKERLGILCISNGSRKPEYYERLLKYAPPASMDMHFSIHLEHAHEEHIENVIRAVASSGQNVTVRFMYNPALPERARAFFTHLLNLRSSVPFIFSMRSLRQPPNFVDFDSRYTQEDFTWMKEASATFEVAADNGPAVIARPDWGSECYEYSVGKNIQRTTVQHYEAMRDNLTNFRGYYCCTGGNVLRVNSDGSFQRAVCSLVKPEMQRLHTINDLNYNTIEIVQCSLNNCGCDANAVIPKFKSKNDAEHYAAVAVRRSAHYKQCEKSTQSNQKVSIVTTEEKVRFRLARMQRLRPPVKRIDPETTFVAVFGEALEDSIAYYGNFDPPLSKLPDFAVADYDSQNESFWTTVAGKYQVQIVSLKERDKLRLPHLCVFVPNTSDSLWGPSGYYALVKKISDIGIDEFFVDEFAFEKIWKRDPHEEYIESRMIDIIRVYEALADEISRDTYLRAIKTVMTGDPGYSRLATYPQYEHPIVRAEKGDVVIEGGLFTGETTYSMAQQVSPHGRVIGFEPMKSFAERSKITVKDCTNVKIEHLGLWSSKNTFFIEDNGGGTHLVSTPTENSEECHSIDIDTYLSEYKECCSCIKLDIEGAEIECLKGAMRTLRHYRPKLMVSLYHDMSHYIDIPLMLLDENLGYTFYIGHHEPYYSETVLYALPPKKYSASSVFLSQKIKNSVVSVVVPAYNSATTLERCLDSILLQQNVCLDIIIVDDASTDTTSNIIERYVNKYPEVVRTVRFTQNVGAGAARNWALGMALGDYITFVDSDDILSENFIETALNALFKHQADIVICSKMRVLKDNSSKNFPLQFGIFTGSEALEQILLRNAGDYSLHSKLFKNDFLRKYNVKFGSTMVHEDLFFLIQSSYHANACIMLPDIGYYQYVHNSGLSCSRGNDLYFESFSKTVCYLTSFFIAHGLSLVSAGYVHCIRTLYGWDRGRICEAIKSACDQNALESLLTSQRLLDIASSKLALSLLTRDCALLFCENNGLKPLLSPESAGWESIASRPLPDSTYVAYKNADAMQGDDPVLTVIMSNYNKNTYLQRSLESILSQSMHDFEIIIVDDASTDGSLATLKDYADKYKCIRLYSMTCNCGQSVCQNMALSKSRSNYITFVDSDDSCVQGFFDEASRVIRNMSPDLIFFNIQVENSYMSEFSDKVFSSHNAEMFYWTGDINPSTWGKVYSKKLILENNIQFIAGIFHQDQPFVLACIRSSKVCVCDSKLAYIAHESINSSLRPTMRGYLHIHSSCLFLNFLWEQWKLSPFVGEIPFPTGHLEFNFNNVFLPAVYAFYNGTGTLGMTDDDFALLQKNGVFLKLLLTTFASLYNENPLREEICLAKPRRLVTLDPPMTFAEKPILSVVIPVYNQEIFLRRCLDSVLSQSLRSLEVLLIDDASTDCTAQVCQEYAMKDSRVIVITNERNRGQGYSRNIALEKARGFFVTYVDSDDCVIPEFFLSGVSALLHADYIDIVNFDCISLDQSGKILKKDSMPLGVYTGAELFHNYCCGYVRSWAAWGKIYRADFLRRNDIAFPEYLHEDNLFLLEAFYFARHILFSGKDGYIKNEVVHEASAMNPISYKPKHVHSFYYLMKEVEEFFKLHPDIPQRDFLFEKRLPGLINFYDKFSGYIASFYSHSTVLLTDEVLDAVRFSPTFLRMILERYADLYARSRGFKPQLPHQDLDPLAVKRQPASKLVPYFFHDHPCEKVTVSVIVPAWNVETTLAKCLDSILSQDIDSFEIILVEDCSDRDSTFSLCLEYARQFSIVRLYQTPYNSGLGVVRNLAVREACGEYVTFVDSDDWMEPYFLRRSLESFNESPEATIVAANVNQVFENKIEKTTFPNATITGEEMLFYYVHGIFKHWGVWSILYRKVFLETNNILCGTAYNEDEIFLLKAYALSDYVCLRSFFGYNYVRFGENESIMRPRVRGKKYFESTLYNLHQVHSFLSQLPVTNDNLKVYDKRLESFRWAHHRDNLLQYIFSCKELGLPSPLTEEVLQTLCCSKVFLRAMLMDHAQLVHAARNPAPLTKPQPQTQYSPKEAYNPTSAQKSSNVQSQKPKAIPLSANELGAGSLLERLLWRISPKRACIKALRRSRMFDADYYRQMNPDVAQAGVDPVYHYVHFGAAEGRNPTPWFNTHYYVHVNPDVAASGINAFYHYLRYGRREGRACGMLDNAVNFSKIPGLDKGPLFERALWHVAPKRACIKALRRSGLVDANYYRQSNPDVAQAGVDPAYHYVHFGAAEGRNPAPWFDTHYYVRTNPDVAASGTNAFYHFLRYGHKEGRRPK